MVNVKTSVKLTLSERSVRYSPASGCNIERPSKTLMLSRDRLSQIPMLSVNFKRSKSVQPPPRAHHNKKLKNQRIQQPRSKLKAKARRKVPKVKEIEKLNSRKLSSRSARLSISSKPLSSSSRVSKAKLSRVASGTIVPRLRKEEGKSRGSRIP